MIKAFKTIALVVLVAFAATAVLCCCVIKNSLVNVTKICSHCATKAKSTSSSHECCFAKASPMEMAKHLTICLLPLLAFNLFRFFYQRPYSCFVSKSIYLHGPPGPLALIPLYIRARSLRI